MTPALKSLMDGYQKFHYDQRNLKLHYIGIPFITLGTIGLCSLIPVYPPYLDGGVLLILANAIFFISKDWKISTPFILLVSTLYFVAQVLPTWALIASFFIGWGSAIAGHKIYEKNEPAFFSNLWETLLGVGVMFMYVKITGIYQSPGRFKES